MIVYCCVWLLIQFTYITLLACLIEHSFDHWRQQHVTVSMSCHKAIVLITRRVHYFLDNMYATPILPMSDLSTLCIVDHLQSLLIMFLVWLAEHSLVNWYQQSLTIHHVPKCMSCHRAFVVITRRAHCFYDNICYTHLASVRFEYCVLWITND